MSLSSVALEALRSYIKDSPQQYLQCRVNRHRMPYLDEKQTKVTKPPELKGQFLAEGDCMNNCGTYIRRIIDRHGYVAATHRGRYVYEQEYRLPRDVLDDPEYSLAEVNAAIRIFQLTGSVA